ncbi:MAG: glycerol-3-phosphate 1-O-acyltransferase PlsY [Fimbriimonadales bacterium]|nr:glycerol-3-phosphate 1-O-acyltransferase PlsY [Fimbriimonadales bacterium]
MKSNPELWILLCVGSFLVGSLPFGYWLAKTRGVDLRKVGSGNIGATNVWRTCGPSLGLPAFLMDVAKAYVPGTLAGNWLALSGFSPEAAILVGICAILGHTFSPFLRFRGGKGVASALGAVLAATPIAGGIAFTVWLAVFLATRYVSLASIVGVIVAPTAAYFLGAPTLVWGLYGGAAVLLILNHRSNIVRLLNGQELRFGTKKEKQGEVRVSNSENAAEIGGDKSGSEV